MRPTSFNLLKESLDSKNKHFSVLVLFCVTTVSGTPSCGDQDGIGSAAKLNQPNAIFW